MEPEIVKIKLQPLTPEAFAPYGVAMQHGKHVIYPEVDEGGRVALELLPLKHRMERVHQLNLHFSYSQAFIPVRGTMIVMVAPAPRNTDAGREKYEFDYDQLAAFYFEPGQAADVARGVWHTLFNVGGLPGQETLFVNVTRKFPGEGPEHSMQIADDVVWFDTLKRDNRVLELALV
jgi:ureidoglycolate hydrolase